MGCSNSGSHMAVGYWGRSIHQRIIAEQEHAKQRELLRAQLEAGGLRAALWQSNTEGNKCACYKEANDQSDRKCKSCHGTGSLPGYLKFGYTTHWMSVVDDDVILTNCEITTEFKSAKVMLSSGATSGTIESGDKAFTRSIVGSTWEYETSTFVRIAASSTVTVEYSLDSGVNWSVMSNLPTANPASGTIRFKATLTRTSTGILSPLFEIVRARFERIAYSGLQASGEYRQGPWILVLRQVSKNRYIKTDSGDAPARTEMPLWTIGLSAFDPDIVVGSRDELINAEDIGPSDFIEFLDGVMVGTRFVMVERSHSDPFAMIIMDQNFLSRSGNPNGPYSIIW